MTDELDKIRMYINQYPNDTMYFLVQMKNGIAVNYDGPHNDPAGVAKARKIIKAIFGERDRIDVMLTVEPVPDLDPPINEEAARLCAKMVQRARGKP